MTNRLGFFLHTPFVPPALLHVLPRANELLRAMCSYDVVGFHTRTYQQAFLDCVREFLGVPSESDGSIIYEGRRVQAVVDPIGIDADGFAQSAVEAERSAETVRLRESLGGRALAIGVDRLDYSKGLVNRFEAFARLLGKIRSTGARSASCRSRHGHAKNCMLTSGCGANWTSLSATPMDGSPNSTGCRCAI